MQVPLLDLQTQYASIKEKIGAAVLEVLASQSFVLGSKVAECEREVAQYCDCTHGIGVSSGTDALLISLMAEGIGSGHEVITTPYTFFATAGCVARLGAKPVFVDIDPQTYNINPAKIEQRVTPRTRAIMPVHLFGQCADMDPILEIAGRHNLAVIEDAAQAIGAEYRGRRAGSMGHYGCFSFFPSKNLGCAGDGGMVTTNDPDRAERLRIFRAHGSKPKYHHRYVGGNFRLDAIQAAIVSVKLKYLEAWTAGRQRNAARYRQLFNERGLIGDGLLIRLPDTGAPSSATAGSSHVYNQFVIRSLQRDALQSHLRTAGIITEVYYPIPMHLQECFANLGYQQGTFLESERAAAETLALPIYPELSADQQRYVVDAISAFYKK